MKQIFDWLREQIQNKKEEVLPRERYLFGDLGVVSAENFNRGIDAVSSLLDEAEAKWGGHTICYLDSPCEYQNEEIRVDEADCCEWKFEKNTGLVWHCENDCESYNIPYQRELKTFLEEFECKCRHCGKPIKISEVE